MVNKNLHLYTEKQKYANGQQWFKDFIDFIASMSTLTSTDFSYTEDEYHRMKINYDLYNGKIDKEDFLDYCKAVGYVYEFSNNFVNEDIISDKIKVLEGLELSRPFYFKVLAVNPEATTRKEQEYFNKYKEFVIGTIMQEIQSKIQQQEMAKLNGKKPSPEEVQKMEQDIQQKTTAATPDEVKQYMEREYQDPAEILASQLLQYMMYSLNIKSVFNRGWKNVTISGREIYRIFIENNEPKLEVINPLNVDFDKNTKTKMIQDGEWCIVEYKYSLIDIAREFPELTDTELSKLSDEYINSSNDDFAFVEGYTNNYINTRHYTWKSLRKIGFLKYIDVTTGELLEKIVPEDYKLQKNFGDIEITFENIIEVYEGWKIGSDTYAKMGRVKYIRDLEDINNVKLPYFGMIYDNDNSISVSLIDRMKTYQYLYDIIVNKIRGLMSSDKGKLLLMNIGLIPRSQHIDVTKWLEYASTMNIGFFNPHEEGNRNLDVNAAAKVLDLSLTSDIQRYIELANYVENRAGESIGITKQIVGRIGPNEAVGNTQQSITQASYVLEPYFALHNIVKRDVLQYLLDTARLAYSSGTKKKLSFALDDLSMQLLYLDKDMLTFNTFGIFISNTTKPDELKQNIVTLAHAALQNQRVEFTDVIKILKTENIEEATDILKVAEDKAKQTEQQNMQAQMQAEQADKEKDRKQEMDIVNLKGKWAIEEEKLKGEYDLQRQTILAMGFNGDKDMNKNGVPDVLELAKYGVDTDIKQRKMDLEEKKFKHSKEMDKAKLDAEKKTSSKKE